MTKLVLEGGTDVAEMVRFRVDDCPARRADDKALSALEARGHAIRMVTGADGGYRVSRRTTSLTSASVGLAPLHEHCKLGFLK